MVEPGGRFKGSKVVAFLAIAVQLPQVKIVVAGGAFIGNGPVKNRLRVSAGEILLFFQVTFFTGSRRMFTLQWISGISLVVKQ